MQRSLSRTVQAILIGVAGSLLLASVVASSDADAARGGKHRRKRDSQPASVDAGKQVVDAGGHDAGKPDAARAVASAGSVDAEAYPSSGLICLYGKVEEDGGERCLSPEELDPPRLVMADTSRLAEQLGMLQREQPDDAGAGDDGGADGAEEDSATSTDGSFKARVVRVQFENGAVGGAQRSLKQIRREMADCVADNGGLRSASARLKLLFYVRADGRASGVMVASARNVPPAVVRCVTHLIEGAAIGRPSNNPVGVKTLIELKENETE